MKTKKANLDKFLCIAKVGSDVVSQAESFSLVQCLVVENSRLAMIVMMVMMVLLLMLSNQGQSACRYLCEVVFIRRVPPGNISRDMLTIGGGS